MHYARYQAFVALQRLVSLLKPNHGTVVPPGVHDVQYSNASAVVASFKKLLVRTELGTAL